MRKFDPSGNGVFEHITIGEFTGVALSEDVAMLTNTDGDTIVFTHPKSVEEYREGLITVTALDKELSFRLDVAAPYHSEIMKIWRDDLRLDSDD